MQDGAAAPGDAGRGGDGAADDGYPPIGDYAVIGDCRTAALVSRRGSVDWLCLPHFSGRALFAALLDRRRGGRFAVRPTGPCRVERRYVGDTNVLETTFHAAGGVVRLTDLMPGWDEAFGFDSLKPERELLRIVEAVGGEPEVEVVFEPRPDFGRAPVRLRRRGALGWACEHRDELFLLHADLPLEAGDGGGADGAAALRARVRLRAGERRYLSLVYERGNVAVVAPLGADADARLKATLGWWEDWIGRCRYDGPYREAVVRSALTLKLMTYALSGAVVAAPTSSLPERIGGSLNWDYRYCWLRDASLTLRAFLDLGWPAEPDAFLRWLLHATRMTWPRLQVLYDVYGRTRLPERALDHLEGYRGSRPVRVGNAAHGQLQLDVYGAVILAACDYVERGGGELDRTEARMLAGFGDTVCKQWREPDNGIWEVRGERRHHTYSKLMCWVALDRLIRLHERGRLRVAEGRFREQRDAIRAAIEAHGFDPEAGGYVGVFEGKDLDASLLLMARHGYRNADDPRMAGTWRLVRRDLDRNGLVYRYGGDYDRMVSGEAAFGICSFWAVDYLVRLGEVDEAAARFERLLTFANDVGLYAEEIEPGSGMALGNFPQAFTHVGLLTAAMSLTGALARTGGARGDDRIAARAS